MRFAWIALGSLLLAGCAAPRYTGLDLHGQPVDPFASKEASVTVLIFISNDCPIANRYAPEFQRLQERFAGRGVAFWLVHADPGETPDEIREHARQFNLSFPEVKDPNHQLARLAKAEVTPSAAVFMSPNRLVYHGRIDDRFVELGQERPQATHHDLVEAIDAVLAGKPVPCSATRAVGCYIPRKP